MFKILSRKILIYLGENTTIFKFFKTNFHAWKYFGIVEIEEVEEVRYPQLTEKEKLK